MRRWIIGAAVAGLTGLGTPRAAAVELASAFTSHMVLQRELRLPVWGTAEPGEQVTVELGDQKRRATADASGRWRVHLDPLTASSRGLTLTVAGSRGTPPLRLEDVLVGEVWLASGQSNMDFTVAKTPKYYFAGVTSEAAEVAAANYPQIRMFTGEWQRAYEPQSRLAGAWKVCTPENVREFSAIGYFFARDLQKDLQVPVGVLTLTFGASTPQAWIRREAIAAHPPLRAILEEFDAQVKRYAPPDEEELAPWRAAVDKATAAGQRPPRRPRPDPTQDQHNPTVMFNGMIAPVVPFAVRGVLWYQGESITGPRELFPAWNETLITDWRTLWGRELPFFFCQLAAHKAPAKEPGPSSIAAVREMQAKALALPGTGMAVTIDIGDENDVHPHNKQDAAARLVRLALAKTYGRDLVHSGPVFDAMRVEGSTARLRFREAHGGLVAKGGPLTHFAVAGEDREFVWADARIDGDAVVVTSPRVPAPVAVRYAWSDNPAGCNLYNGAGLPAVPFRTDLFLDEVSRTSAPSPAPPLAKPGN